MTTRGQARWFYGFCDLTDKSSRDAMRPAILAHETATIDSMTREEKLEAIQAAMPPDKKGRVGELNPATSPPADLGKRALLINAGKAGTIIKLLGELTDAEIDGLLPDSLKAGGP